MKTQNFGRGEAWWDYSPTPSLPYYFWTPSALVVALKNYKENRENGSLKDNPRNAFPSSGLEGCESFSKEFAWEGDEKRDYPNPTQDSKGKNERYWFIVKHKQSGQRIEGFYQEPDYKKGFPDARLNYWYRVVFTDTENPAIRAWMTEKDLNYLDRIQKEGSALYQQAITAHPDIHQKQLARQRERGIVIDDEQKKRTVSVASKKQGKEEKDRNYQSRLAQEERATAERQRQGKEQQQMPLPLRPTELANVAQSSVDSRKDLHIKTKTWGAVPFSGSGYPSPFCMILELSITLSSLGFHSRDYVLFCRALKNYRNNRENGNHFDNPRNPFPSAGFDLLHIAASGVKRRNASKWPESCAGQDRYWWEIKLTNGEIIKDFYLTKDEERGCWVEGNERNDACFWFIIHHKYDTTIKGFSIEPDYDKGYPDSDEKYWWRIKYTECGAIKAWMEEKDRNYLARLKREEKARNEKKENARQVSQVRQSSRSPSDFSRLPSAAASSLFSSLTPVNQEGRPIALPPIPAGQGAPVPLNRLQAAQQAAAKIQAADVRVTPPGLENKPLSQSRGKAYLAESFGQASEFVLRHDAITLDKHPDGRDVVLGRGSFGEVYRGRWHGIQVAVKKLLLVKLTHALADEFKHECTVMFKLRHPNILELYGIVVDPERCMVMEFMAKGSLSDVLHSDEPLSWAMLYQFGLGAAQGLLYLHEKKIVHRDLKSLNVLLDKDYQVKLADFGLSCIKTSSSQSLHKAGTTQWIAPELLLDATASFTEACDVYSLAMVLWELMSRQVPYRNLASPALVPIHVGYQGQRETIPAQAPLVMQAVTEAGWKQQPEDRPTAAQLCDELRSQPVTDTTPIPSPHVKRARVADEGGPSDSRGYVAQTKSSERSAGPLLMPVSSGRYVEGSHMEQRPQKSLPTSPSGDKGNVPLSPQQQLGQSDYLPGSYADGASSGNRLVGDRPASGHSSSSSSSSALFKPAATPLPPLPEDEDVIEAVATHNYLAPDVSQLSLIKGAKLTVIEQQSSGWWLCELNGKRGLAPSNRLQLIEPVLEEGSGYQAGFSGGHG